MLFCVILAVASFVVVVLVANMVVVVVVCFGCCGD